jgi:hypothetical protein
MGLAVPAGGKFVWGSWVRAAGIWVVDLARGDRGLGNRKAKSINRI